MVQNEAQLWDGFGRANIMVPITTCENSLVPGFFEKEMGKNLHFLQFFFSSLSQQPHAQVLLHSIRAKFCAHLNGIQGR